MAPTEILIIRQGSSRLGLDLARVREVLRMLQATPLPGAPRGVLGAINLRGEMIPLLDLEARLPTGAGAPGLEHHVIVLDAGLLLPLAIAVTQALEIEPVPPESWQETRSIVPEAPISGAVRSGTGFIAVLDPSRLLGEGEVESLASILKTITAKAGQR